MVLGVPVDPAADLQARQRDDVTVKGRVTEHTSNGSRNTVKDGIKLLRKGFDQQVMSVSYGPLPALPHWAGITIGCLAKPPKRKS